MYFKDGPPRSRIFYDSTFMPTELGPHFPLFDTKNIDLANLFSREEQLATKIADGNLDKPTLNQVVEVVQKIARMGHATILVSLDDRLDVAQILFLTEPALDKQNFTRWVDNYLQELLEKLPTTGNTSWDATVVAALAYFSVKQ